MIMKVILPRTYFCVPSYYAKNLLNNNFFRDVHKEDEQHFFRGIKNQYEKRRFIEEKYSIGPHDERLWVCAGHSPEIFGWWFNPEIHDREVDDDDVFWPIAVDLTPDHLDLRSKIKLINEFNLSPDKNWKPYFGPDWFRAYKLAKTDPIIISLINAENTLIDIAYFIKNFSKNFRESGYELNIGYFLELFQHLNPLELYPKINIVRDILTDHNLLTIISKNKLLRDLSYSGTEKDQYLGFNVIESILMSAFAPDIKTLKPSGLNLENFRNVINILKNSKNFSAKKVAEELECADVLTNFFGKISKSYYKVLDNFYIFNF